MLDQAADRGTTPAVLTRAVEHASEWLAGLDTRPVGARTDLETLRARLHLPLPERGTEPTRIIDELVAQTEGGHHGSASGRFYAWVIGGSLDSALAADWLTSAWDGNSGLYAVAPASAVVEEVAGAWIKELFDLRARHRSRSPPGARWRISPVSRRRVMPCCSAWDGMWPATD